MPKTTRDSRLVAALLYDGLCTFEFSIAAEVFGLHRPEMGNDWYKFAAFSEEQGSVHALGGIEIKANAGLEILAKAGTIIIPGWRSENAKPSAKLEEALRQAHTDGARLVTICSGAFLLAEMGLLDGRTATTHWRYAERLERTYPKITVAPEVLYVDSDDILTSAGSSAGIDLLLHIVRKDFGADAANAVARRLVMPSHREGGQLQFISAPVPPVYEGHISHLLDSLRASPAHDWSIQEMARLTTMSERTFARRFKALTGQSPGEWLISERIRLACRMLETSQATVAEISDLAGFGSPENLTRQLKKRMGVSPGRYRVAFGS